MAKVILRRQNKRHRAGIPRGTCTTKEASCGVVMEAESPGSHLLSLPFPSPCVWPEGLMSWACAPAPCCSASNSQKAGGSPVYVRPKKTQLVRTQINAWVTSFLLPFKMTPNSTVSKIRNNVMSSKFMGFLFQYLRLWLFNCVSVWLHSQTIRG